MLAYANPGDRKERYGPQDRGSAGFGVVRFDKRNRTIAMECWPRDADVTEPGKYRQYPGWPMTVTQEGNYARKAVAWLPAIRCKTMVNPVVQVINEKTGETVYTLRINGKNWQPKVFEDGIYTLRVGGQGVARRRTFAHVKSRKERAGKSITIP